MALKINRQNFQQKRYVIHIQNGTDYGESNENDTSITFETKNITSRLCDYSDAYPIVTGDITTTGGDTNTNVAFKNCAPFTKCITHINDEHAHTAEEINITMPMNNLIEYSNNYSDTSGRLWQFKRDKSPVNNTGNRANFNTNDSSLF